MNDKWAGIYKETFVAFIKVLPGPKNVTILIRVNISVSDRLYGLVVRVPGYRSGGPSYIPGTTRKK
jgi:hypothetical protein